MHSIFTHSGAALGAAEHRTARRNSQPCRAQQARLSPAAGEEAEAGVEVARARAQGPRTPIELRHSEAAAAEIAAGASLRP